MVFDITRQNKNVQIVINLIIVTKNGRTFDTIYTGVFISILT